MEAKSRYNLVSVVAGLGSMYVGRKRPTDLLPFKGDLPLLNSIDLPDYREAIENTELLTNLTPQFQEVATLSYRIADFVQSFTEFLLNKNISVEDYAKMGNATKSNHIVAWLDQEHLDFNQLEIKRTYGKL